jgi:hypothetical protein
MNEGKSPTEHKVKLLARRSELAKERLAPEKRATYGPSIVSQFFHATGYNVGLDDFDTSLTAPVIFTGATLELASDWTLLHVGEVEAMEALVSLNHCIPTHEGLVGVEGNTYLGLHRSVSISLIGLLKVASILEDSVIFFPSDSDTALVMDCYHGPGGRSFYSFYVKGAALASCLKGRRETS